MLQIAWQKEANQIVECHNLVQNSIVSQILEIKIRGVCSAGSVSFESRVAGNDKAINQSCLVFHLTRSLFAKTSPVHCYVHHHYCWAFRLQQNILFYDVCYTDLRLTWFDCFQKITKSFWLVESQTIKDVLTFALQKMHFYHNPQMICFQQEKWLTY